MVQFDTLMDLKGESQAVAYMYPELVGSRHTTPDDVFEFQYHPKEISDAFGSGFIDKPIPGGSQPIQQYVGGQTHSITFSAEFTSEIKNPGIPSRGIPSDNYTVDLVAVMQKIRTFQHPLYRQGGDIGVVEPPPRLKLVFPGLELGRDKDAILVTLRDASFTIMKQYPSGTPRRISVSFQFQESIQFSAGTGTSVRFIDREDFVRAKDFKSTSKSIDTNSLL